MYSNLNTTSGFKEVLLKKLSYAVICSVLSHLIVVFLYVFIINFSVQPTKWLMSTFETLTSRSTWLYLIPFASIIFAQIVICAKDYVLKSTCELTRFRKFIAIFSVRTFVLGLLHVVVGGLAVWLYLSLTRGQYRSLYIEPEENKHFLVEGSFFMILSGLWIGFYFFVRVYIADRNMVFPVIQQRKLLHFKAKFVPLLKASKVVAFYPTMYYFILYYICGSYLCSSFAYSFGLRIRHEAFNLWLYSYTWVFTTLYIINMNLMRFFFELFLTEPVEHPVMAVYDNDTSLTQALLLNSMPILQHLGCLDLYLLSIWSKQRRQALFTLSQPGGHPHTWNRLIQGALKLMSEFTDTLNKATDILLDKEEKPKSVIKNKPVLDNTSPLLQSPLTPHQKPQKYHNIRNMSLVFTDDSLNTVTISQHLQNKDVPVISETVTQRATSIFESINNLRIVKYLFGKLPEADIQQCLKNGQLIVWTTQGVANIAVASFHEDPYGIVQKDLPVLITTLVQLKQSMDQLSKVPLFSRKGPNFDEFSFKMKNSVSAAVRRSLCNICRTFGRYLNDIPLKKDVAMQLQCYL